MDTGNNVFLVSRPELIVDGLEQYLKTLDVFVASKYTGEIDDRLHDGTTTDAEEIATMFGKLCYRSWHESLNPNLTSVRNSVPDYVRNLIKQAHGSVLEHVNFGFIIISSRIATHEQVRHRAGTAYSQESQRYVRLSDGIPFDMPIEFSDNDAVLGAAAELLKQMDAFQRLVADEYGLDEERSFHTKKRLTSAARRLAPSGVSTVLGMTANARALRHMLEIRTNNGAEREIRDIYNKIGIIMQREMPSAFSDFALVPGDDDIPQWVPARSKA